MGGAYEAHEAAKQMAKKKFNLVSDDLPLVPYNKSSAFSEIFFGAGEVLFPEKTFVRNLIPTSVKFGRTPLYLWE